MRGLLERHKELLDVSYEEAYELGARAADAAVAQPIWSTAIGERWDTTTVAEFLDVTRQAVHKRLRSGSLLGIAGRGTTWFPVWQFDSATRGVRPVVADILAAFRAEFDVVDPLVVASWATTEQPELAMPPEDWIASDRDCAVVARIARRAAAELAR